MNSVHVTFIYNRSYPSGMVKVPYLSLNRNMGIMAVAFVVMGLAWSVFSLIYVTIGLGWDGSDAMGFAWMAMGGVILFLSLPLLIAGGGLMLANYRARKKEIAGDEEEPPVKLFDLNRIEGVLALVMVPLSVVFLINGVVFYVVYKAMWDPKNIEAKRMAMDFKGGATWLFVLMVGLWIAAGICLFLNRYFVMEQEGVPQAKKDKKKPPKKEDKPKKKRDRPLPPPPED